MIHQQLLTRCVFDVIILLLAIILVTFIILFVYTDLFEVHKQTHVYYFIFDLIVNKIYYNELCYLIMNKFCYLIIISLFKHNLNVNILCIIYHEDIIINIMPHC